MFFHRRATQAEYFDSPDRSLAEIVESYEALARINRLFAVAEPFRRRLPILIGAQRCRELSILDLGAGDGSLGAQLAAWARSEHGWDWRVTNVDLSVPALRLSRDGNNVAASVLALPFRDGSFDVVIASQMTHHLEGDAAIIRHLREAWRVSRLAIFLNDLHRGAFLYSMVWLLFQFHRFPPHFREDGLLSVKRGFRVNELQKLAEEAGIPDARAWLYYRSRVMLEASKGALTRPIGHPLPSDGRGTG
jgi:2-polyprenyl-3-methyl-5-hydroxy-6-metoxy-1,4-benzoquinol methylase